jgi:hypothetical protein
MDLKYDYDTLVLLGWLALNEKDETFSNTSIGVGGAAWFF